MTESSSTLPAAPTAPRRRRFYAVLWLFFGVAILASLLACMFVYVEYRLQHFTTTLAAQPVSKPSEQPIRQTLRSLQDQAATATAQIASLAATLDDHTQILKTREEQSVSAAMTKETLKEITQMASDITNLKDTIRAMKKPGNAYALVLRDATILEAKLAKKSAVQTLVSLMETLDNITITPEHLTARARIASNSESLMVLLRKNDIASREALLSDLQKILQRPATHEKAPQEETFGLWHNMRNTFGKHVHIRKEADAAFEDAREQLQEAALGGRLEDAARIVASLDAVPKNLSSWFARARLRIQAERLLHTLQTELSALAREE